ncbi:MAG: DUF4350 domain-containing protein [Halolamina sp.]
MRRRRFLGALTASGLVGSTLESARAQAGDARSTRAAVDARSQAESIPELMFDSTCSLLSPDGTPLMDDGLVAVTAAESARISDADGDGDAVEYGDDPVPLVAVDGVVAGVGAPIAEDEIDFAYGNDEFYLNLWDELVGGGTVLWDEGHEQYYDLARHQTFRSYAEERGYAVEPTTALAEDLGGADAVVITSPTAAFSEAELSALAEFAAGGGAVFLHSQSDYRNFDATANIDAVAEALGVGFRFNDGQVVDEESNAGPSFTPITDGFNADAFPALFEDRQGINAGPQFEFDEAYTATVSEVADGDTFTVEFPDGGTDEVRVLGVDTPETPANAEAELPHEWEGLGGVAVDDDYPHLASWGDRASAFAKERLRGTEVTLTFDRNEGIADPFGRALAYVTLDDGTLYSETLVREGYARVFDSGHRRHDDLLRAELTARENGTGLWAESTPAESEPVRTGPVESLFFPNPAGVTTTDGPPSDERVAVFAEPSASAPETPLVGVAPAARVAVVAAPFVDERHEDATGFPVSTASFGNFTFLTNLVDALADRPGDVLVDSGHGQFGTSGALSAEDVSFYQRYLEGVGIGLEGVNEPAGGLLDRGRALVVTAPADAYGDEALSAVRSFRDAGGAVVLMGSAAAETSTQINLNSVAQALGTDLRVSLSSVTDARANVDGKASIPTSANFNDAYGLFDAYEPGRATIPRASTATATASDAGAESTTAADGTATGEETTSSSAPGMGVLSAVASTVGGALVLSRRRGDDGGDAE